MDFGGSKTGKDRKDQITEDLVSSAKHRIHHELFMNYFHEKEMATHAFSRHFSSGNRSWIRVGWTS
jgi:hypothetical protein